MSRSRAWFRSLSLLRTLASHPQHVDTRDLALGGNPEARRLLLLLGLTPADLELLTERRAPAPVSVPAAVQPEALAVYLDYALQLWSLPPESTEREEIWRMMGPPGRALTPKELKVLDMVGMLHSRLVKAKDTCTQAQEQLRVQAQRASVLSAEYKAQEARLQDARAELRKVAALFELSDPAPDWNVAASVAEKLAERVQSEAHAQGAREDGHIQAAFERELAEADGNVRAVESRLADLGARMAQVVASDNDKTAQIKYLLNELATTIQQRDAAHDRMTEFCRLLGVDDELDIDDAILALKRRIDLAEAEFNVVQQQQRASALGLDTTANTNSMVAAIQALRNRAEAAEAASEHGPIADLLALGCDRIEVGKWSDEYRVQTLGVPPIDASNHRWRWADGATVREALVNLRTAIIAELSESESTLTADIRTLTGLPVRVAHRPDALPEFQHSAHVEGYPECVAPTPHEALLSLYSYLKGLPALPVKNPPRPGPRPMTLIWPWSRISFFTLPEGPGVRWRTGPYYSKNAAEGMVEYRLTLHGDVVCLCPDGGQNHDPVPIEPSMTWDEAVSFLGRCGVAPPVRYNGPPDAPYAATSISFVLAPASGPWHAWTGYVPDIGDTADEESPGSV